MELWDDALPATRSARRRFSQSGDTRRAANAELLEANILFEQGQTDAARAKWLRLTKVLAALKRGEDLGRVWINLGVCEIRRQRPADARRWLNLAHAAFRALKNTAEIARTRWNMGTYIASFEDGSRALRVLRSAYRLFLSLRSWIDAGCVGLDMLDIAVNAEAPDDQLTLLAGGVADTLARAALGDGIAPAIAELRRIAYRDDRRRVLRMVRSGLRDAKANCSEVSIVSAIGEAG